MEAVNKALQALRDGIKATSGIGKGQRTGTAAATKTSYRSVDIMGLPMNLDEFEPLQVLDDGANFGKFYFLDGFSQEGGSDIRR